MLIVYFSGTVSIKKLNGTDTAFSTSSWLKVMFFTAERFILAAMGIMYMPKGETIKSRRPIISISFSCIPVSSKVSRTAVSSGDSLFSARPPGKQKSPG